MLLGIPCFGCETDGNSSSDSAIGVIGSAAAMDCSGAIVPDLACCVSGCVGIWHYF